MPAALTHPDGVVRPIQAYQDLPDLLFRFSPWKARVSEESRYLCCAALHWGSMSDGYLRATEALVAAGAPLDPTGATCRQERCNIQRTARTRPPRGSMRLTHAACNPACKPTTAKCNAPTGGPPACARYNCSAHPSSLIVPLLLSPGHNGQTPLMWAATRGAMLTIHFLIERGCKLDLVDSMGYGSPRPTSAPGRGLLKLGHPVGMPDMFQTVLCDTVDVAYYATGLCVCAHACLC